MIPTPAQVAKDKGTSALMQRIIQKKNNSTPAKKIEAETKLAKRRLVESHESESEWSSLSGKSKEIVPAKNKRRRIESSESGESAQSESSDSEEVIVRRARPPIESSEASAKKREQKQEHK